MGQICKWRLTRCIVALLLAGLAAGVARPQAPSASAGATPNSATGKPASPSVETPEPPDKVVLKVGDQQFTKADLDYLFENIAPQARQALATQGKKPLGDQFALMVMLSQQAHLHHLDQTPAFVHKLALQKQQMEAQAEYQEINEQAKATPEEINQYYSSHAADYDEIMVRQFVIYKRSGAAPTASGGTTAPAGRGLAPEEANARAEAIRKELAGGTDIKKVMEDFKAPGVVIIDPEPRKIRRTSMRPELAKVAFALKDGEISEPVDLSQALILFQVTGHTHLDVKDVTPEIEKSFHQEKVDAALATLKKKAQLWMDEQYFAAPSQPSQAPKLSPPAANTPPKP